MDRERQGGWVYIMADRYRGTMYVGVTAHLARRVMQHHNDEGAAFCRRYGLHRLVWAERLSTMVEAIEHEKRVKRWRRAWKIALIERANPEWQDLFGDLI
jgi:putative endonuclease